MGNLTKKNLLTAAQCRAARGLLGLSQSQLADLANLSKSSVARFEAGGPLATNNHIALDMAIEREGIEMIDPNGGGLGVRFRDPARRGDEKA
jgi:transcriptional regulator with XRE-family HTH domain